MASLLSLLGTSVLNANAFLKIVNNDDFINLANDINENGIAEYNERLVVKFLYKNFDPFVVPFLQNKANKEIFNNDKLSKEQKIKMYTIKLVSYLYDVYNEMRNKTGGIEFMKQKGELVKDMSEEFCTHINATKVNSGHDIYKILLEHYGLQFSGVLTKLISEVTLSDTSLQLEKSHTFRNSVMKSFNDTYMYTPYLYDENRNKDNDSDNDSDTDDDGDSGNNGNNDNSKNEDNNSTNKTSTKRPRDENTNDDNTDNDDKDNNDKDNNEDKTDPKKRRNE